MSGRRTSWPSSIEPDINRLVEVGDRWLADHSNPKIDHDILYEMDGKTWILSDREWGYLLELFMRFVPAMDPLALQRLSIIAHYSDWTKDQLASLCNRVVECADVEGAIELVDLVLHRLQNDDCSIRECWQFVGGIIRSQKFRSKDDENLFLSRMSTRLSGK
ncbi:MAG: hypothetical protein JJU33_01890 [Phycisphaerales bacterium]|nr:hypothetical protein [Phycisphaerales bacterium]